MKRIIMIVLLLVTGIGIIAYPFIGNYLNQKNATKVAENYKKNVDKLSSEDIANIFQKAQTYNENLLGSRLMTLLFQDLESSCRIIIIKF